MGKTLSYELPLFSGNQLSWPSGPAVRVKQNPMAWGVSSIQLLNLPEPEPDTYIVVSDKAGEDLAQFIGDREDVYIVGELGYALPHLAVGAVSCSGHTLYLEGENDDVGNSDH